MRTALSFPFSIPISLNLKITSSRLAVQHLHPELELVSFLTTEFTKALRFITEEHRGFASRIFTAKTQGRKGANESF
jgi:hypothetical protein